MIQGVYAQLLKDLKKEKEGGVLHGLFLKPKGAVSSAFELPLLVAEKRTAQRNHKTKQAGGN
jgi:hypothetical protein